MAGHIMTIVRNILGEEVSNNVGKIRMLRESGEEVCFAFGYQVCCLLLCVVVLSTVAAHSVCPGVGLHAFQRTPKTCVMFNRNLMGYTWEQWRDLF